MRDDLVPDSFSLETVDTDGAIQETAERAGYSRLDLLRRAAIGGGALASSGALLGALPGVAAAAPSKAGDIAILNFALTLEYLEAAFYAEAVREKDLKGETALFAKTVAVHERQHVQALLATIPKLGGKPVKQPNFNFQGTTANDKPFQKVALALESTGVGAYQGQAVNIKEGAVLAAAASILPVEAQHYAWMLALIGSRKPLPAPVAFSSALTKKQVLAIVGKTGFITA